MLSQVRLGAKVCPGKHNLNITGVRFDTDWVSMHNIRFRMSVFHNMIVVALLKQ